MVIHVITFISSDFFIFDSCVMVIHVITFVISDFFIFDSCVIALVIYGFFFIFALYPILGSGIHP